MADTTWYVTQFTFNSVTYDEDAGGPLTASLREGAREEEERVAGQIYPTAVEMANASAEASIEIAEFQKDSLPSIGTKSNIVLTIKKNDGTTATETWYNMKFGGRDANQGRATAGRSTYRWVFESSDGIKGPTEAPA